MAFGSLVPGMAPMPIPQMRPNAMLQQGMQIMNMARQRQPGQPGQPPQGLLQRLLNPQAAPGAPMELAAPGMTPDGSPAGGIGLLSKLFPMMGGGGMPPMGGGSTMPPNILGGLY